MPRGTVTDWELVERLHNEGLSAPKIAEQVGCTLRTVQRWRHNAGVALPPTSPFTGKAISPERMDVARRMVEDGAPISEIHKTTGIRSARLTRLFPGAAWSHKQTGELSSAVRRFNKVNQVSSERREA